MYDVKIPTIKYCIYFKLVIILQKERAFAKIKLTCSQSVYLKQKFHIFYLILRFEQMN